MESYLDTGSACPISTSLCQVKEQLVPFPESLVWLCQDLNLQLASGDKDQVSLGKTGLHPTSSFPTDYSKVVPLLSFFFL